LLMLVFVSIKNTRNVVNMVNIFKNAVLKYKNKYLHTFSKQ